MKITVKDSWEQAECDYFQLCDYETEASQKKC